MKKIRFLFQGNSYCYLRKLLLIMKLSSFLLFICVASFGATGYSQSEHVSIKLKDAKLKDFFGAVEQQTSYKFLYRDDAVEKIIVNLDESDKPLDQVLDIALANAGLSYKIFTNNLIVIASKDVLQEKPVTGDVKDAATGEPLPGVYVVLKGTATGVITGVDGTFSIKVPDGTGTLVFSSVGYTTQEIPVEGRTSISVQLAISTTSLDEVVVVGYGTQKKSTVTGSVASMKSSQLTIAPIASLSNSLAGQLPGLISLQSSGQPGFDQAALSIRGFSGALVIVDGIESDFNNIDANEIESVSILKDGAASIYGARAGNGVILITTKRGKNEKPIITLNTSYTMQGITAMPKPSSAGQYAEMQSETWLQSGKDPSLVPFTKEQILKYYNGGDPLYPNTDWYNELVRTWAPQAQTNLSVRGGSERIKYYGFLGWLKQETVWKNGGGDYNRYNIQSNIDAKITDNLSLQFDLSSIIENRHFPWRPMAEGSNTVWQDFWNTLPIYPATLPDPAKETYNGGEAQFMTNRSKAGYNNQDAQNLKASLALNYNFSFIKGLSAKAFVNGTQNFYANKNFTRPGFFYTYDPASEIYTLKASLGSKAADNQSKSQDRTLTGQFSLYYDREFGSDHHLTALALYEVIDFKSDYISAFRQNFLTPAIDQLFAGSSAGWTNDGSANEWGRASYVGRINYSYKDKYLLETILRADASAKFPPENRWGYFPSVSLGWRLSKENFMSGLSNIDELKLRASYGQSGNDAVGNFQYLTGYQYGHLYILDAAIQQGLVSTGLPNPDLTWEKISIMNAGVDFSLFQRKLYGEGDAFYRTRSGIPATRIATLPSTFGSPLPPENLNSLNDRGFEFKAGSAGRGLGNELIYDVSGFISWSQSKWDHFEEPDYTDPDQQRIYTKSGTYTDRQFGYISDGLFTSQAQIDALPYDMDMQGNVSLRPGDIIYKNTNGDDKLDWKDQVEIGKGTVPHWMMGFSVNLKYKNFDFNSLFQGAFGYYNYVNIVHGGLMPAIVYDLRWKEETNDAGALIPRLGGSPTNNYVSDYYYKKAGYLRWKTLSFGYSLPKQWVEKIRLQQLRIYFAGVNLLTFDKLKDYGIDPEAPSGNGAYYYPQQRTLTFGINMSF
jgi:TonB-linked SusC/RagA family outer membrane protein